MNLQVETQFGYASGFNVDFSFVATGGEVTSLVGPSGSGKSTLLALVAGLLDPSSGNISTSDETFFCAASGINLKPWRRNTGMLFQQDTLFPHLSVRKNLLFGSPNSSAMHWQFDNVVEAFAIGDLLNRKPPNLSGGQRDRVALGRALLSQPQVLLLDEPLASVEESLRDSIFDFVSAGIEQQDIPMLLVSHDQGLLSRSSGQTLEIRDGSVRR